MKHLTSIGLLVFSTLTFSALSLANTSLPNNRHIAVTGKAEMMAMPDIAIVHLAVESSKKKQFRCQKRCR